MIQNKENVNLGGKETKWWRLTTLGLPGSSVIKNPPANAEDMGSIPGLGRFSGEENGNPYPVFLPGKSHRQEPGRLQSMGSQRVRHDLTTKQLQE